MNIVSLANTIQTAMKQHLDQHPDATQEQVEASGLKAAMVYSRGRCNPVLVDMLCRLETSIYPGSPLSKKGMLRC